jgi:Mor family transcriptional regulator
VRDIRKRAAEGEKGTELAKSYMVSKETIYNIIKRRTWKHI